MENQTIVMSVEDPDIIYLDPEEWRVIEEFPNYEVSDCGRVRNKNTGKLMKLGELKSGSYKTVSLKKKGCKSKGCQVHRLVAQAFIPNPLNLSLVNHKNGVKYNNNLENLEWITSRDNTLHSIHVLGNRRKGYDIYRIDSEGNEEYYPSVAEAIRINKVSREALMKACESGEEYCKYKWRKGDNIFEPYIQEEDEKERDIPYLEGFTVTSFGRVYNRRTGLLRKLNIMEMGYYAIRIRGNNYYIAHLVADTFLAESKPKENPIVNHKDGNKLNNRLENLEWLTQLENIQHAIRTGLIKTKPLAVYDNTGILAVFPYANIVKKELKVKTDIQKICLGGRKTALGHKWKYITKEEYDEYKVKPIDITFIVNPQGKKKVGKYDIDLNLIETFESATTAARSCDILSFRTFYDNMVYKGYIWKFIEDESIKRVITAERLKEINGV